MNTRNERSPSSKGKPGRKERNYYLPNTRVSMDSSTGEQRLVQHILSRDPLFTKITDSDTCSIPSLDTTFLIKGFGMRNLQSLQDALRINEMRRLEELFMKEKEMPGVPEHSLEEQSECYSSLDKSEAISQTEITSTTTSGETSDKRLQYLMGIAETSHEEEEEGAEEGPKVHPIPFEVSVEESLAGVSESMKQAQKYLKSHRIFEFFQFITAHMLSKLPTNPIDFIVDLLDKCLVFRSGYGEPPLLYTHTHLEQLFYLMDPMRTGYIEEKQYRTGMVTLGICSYNKNPPLSPDGLVSKSVFEEEAYECLTSLLTSMIRQRWVGNPPPVTPPPTPQVGSTGVSFEKCECSTPGLCRSDHGE